MKVRMMLILTCLLMWGCSNEADTEALNDASSVEQNDGEKVAVEQTGTQETIIDEKGQYYKVLVDLLNEIGTKYNGNIFNSFNDFQAQHGIVYAELIDFDKDGNDELYVVLESDSYFDFELAHRQRQIDGYVQEVWQATSLGEAKLVHYAQIPKDDCLNCGTSFSLLEQVDGKTILNIGREEYSEDAAFATFIDTYVSIGTGEEMQFIYEVGENLDVMHLNGEIVSEEIYRAEKEALNLPERKIIENEYGIYKLHFDFESSAAYVGKFLRELAGESQPDLPSASADVIAAVEGETMRYWPIDILNKDLHKEMMGNIIMHYMQDLSLEYVELEANAGVVVEAAESAFNETYGIPFEAHLDNGETLGDTSVTFEDGHYQLFIGADYSPPKLIRLVENAFEIKENTYYLELLDVEFDHFAYWVEEMDIPEPTVEQLLQPYGEWQHEWRYFGKTDIHRYAVVQLDGEDVIYKYLSYEPLTVEKMEAY